MDLYLFSILLCINLYFTRSILFNELDYNILHVNLK